MAKHLAIIALLSVLSVKQAHAYIDPGSGSVLFQAAAAGIIGVIYALRMKIKALFASARSMFAGKKSGGTADKN